MSTSPQATSSTKPAAGWAEAQPVLLQLSPLSDRCLLFHADQAVADFVKRRASRLPGFGWPWYRAIGLIEDMRLVGGVVFHDYYPEAGDISFSAAFDSPSWCTPAALRGMLFYPLHTLNILRCTARTAESNAKARRFLVRWGFREEGRLRRAFDGDQDVIIYGALRHELKFKGITG